MTSLTTITLTYTTLKMKVEELFFLLLTYFSYCVCFQCPGYDIPRKFRCDGINNCGDNSDEEGCPGGNR